MGESGHSICLAIVFCYDYSSLTSRCSRVSGLTDPVKGSAPTYQMYRCQESLSISSILVTMLNAETIARCAVTHCGRL